MSDDGLIADQVAYYRARAAEYDATTTPPGDPYASYGDATRATLRAGELETRLRHLGWRIAVRTAGPFYWGGGARSTK